MAEYQRRQAVPPGLAAVKNETTLLEHPQPYSGTRSSSCCKRKFFNCGIDTVQTGDGSTQCQGHLCAGTQTLVTGNMLFNFNPDPGTYAEMIQDGFRYPGDIIIIRSTDINPVATTDFHYRGKTRYPDPDTAVSPVQAAVQIQKAQVQAGCRGNPHRFGSSAVFSCHLLQNHGDILIWDIHKF